MNFEKKKVDKKLSHIEINTCNLCNKGFQLRLTRCTVYENAPRKKSNKSYLWS
jgi:hypothetical protein